MTRIVTTTYRYKRPPKKRKAVALEVPTIVTRAKKPDRVPIKIDTETQPAPMRSGASWCGRARKTKPDRPARAAPHLEREVT